MGKQYNAELQAKVEAYMKETGDQPGEAGPDDEPERSGIKPVPPQRL